MQENSSPKWNYPVSEEAFMILVNLVIDKFAKSFSFGIHDKEDIAQEIYQIALEKTMPNWDGKRNLYKFLLIDIKNKLKNFKRNKWYRPECPCRLCNNQKQGETEHRDGKYCKKFLDWKKRNSRKANIAAPPSIPEDFGNQRAGNNPDVVDKLVNKELSNYIDKKLPVKLRGIYLRMKSGVKVTNVEKQAVLKFLKTILKNQ